jgi:multicomponent Na+:H+ antiporter subunit C
VTTYVYAVAAWLVFIGMVGIVRSRNLVHAIVCLAIAQSGTYVLLVGIGFQRAAAPPVFGEPAVKPSLHVVDPVVQAMTLTDIVVSATVTAMLLALTIQIHKARGSTNPDELNAIEG